MSTPQLSASGNPSRCIAVADQTERLCALVRDVDLSTPVPTCPGWTLADLIQHVGSVQRWFSVLLQLRVQEPPKSREVSLDLPERPELLPEWLAASMAVATHAFESMDPDLPMWAWGEDQHARFWVRRMLFETLVHRADAELALGITPQIAPGTAADGVDEFLVNLPYAGLFAPGVKEMRGSGETIRFKAIDVGDEWVMRLRPDGFGIVETPSTIPASSTIRGTAADLLLFLYGRLPHNAPTLKVTGDAALVARWSVHSKF
ncbi:maleylpyruvate isomerase family mycothiol-dependent enzyme [Nocardia sp. CA-151230]|uniref:maleylpyruvate isomerase family mycothiol-dependent enzyme n=1 Tax=Nocardia sp. CA-151230 TaxID=3239982 RepID=UPI003D9318E4